MNTDQALFSDLKPENNISVQNAALSRSILSRMQALKGIKITLEKTKGKTYKKVVPEESIQTEVIAPVFDAPQVIEEVPVSEFTVPEVPVMETYQVPEEVVPVMEAPQSVEETPPMEMGQELPVSLNNPRVILGNISEQRGIIAPPEMPNQIVISKGVIDSQVINELPVDENLVSSEIGVPQLESVPNMYLPVENYEPTQEEEQEVQLVSNMDLPVDNYEPTQEEEQGIQLDSNMDMPVQDQEEEQKPVNNNKVFSPIGPTNEDDLTEVLDILDKKEEEEIELKDDNERLQAELDAEREAKESLEASLKFEQDKAISFSESVKRLEEQKAQLEKENAERIQHLENDARNKENKIIELSAIADKAVENEKTAEEYKRKYHLLRGKVYEYVKKSESKKPNVKMTEETQSYKEETEPYQMAA